MDIKDIFSMMGGGNNMDISKMFSGMQGGDGNNIMSLLPMLMGGGMMGGAQNNKNAKPQAPQYFDQDVNNNISKLFN